MWGLEYRQLLKRSQADGLALNLRASRCLQGATVFLVIIHVVLIKTTQEILSSLPGSPHVPLKNAPRCPVWQQVSEGDTAEAGWPLNARRFRVAFLPVASVVP